MGRRIKNFFHLLEAVTANILYGFPSRKLRILAITGTDGKTTTSTLLYHMLNMAGRKVALISTVAAYIGNDEIDTGFHVTNPSPFALQKLLKKTVDAGIEFVVLEVTSHGIDQQRNWGIHPEVAAITNVTHEHLDYHKTYENYVATKARLLLSASHAILNKDAVSSYTLLKHILKSAGKAYGVVEKDTLSSTLVKATKRRFGTQAYNFENVAVASSMAKQVGLNEKEIATAIKSFAGVAGRMEEIKNEKGIRIIVDFAHTPNALERALQAVRSKEQRAKNSKLVVVFGCAGARDVSKRPMMGKIAVELADLAIFTAEDPRFEDIWTIIHQMKSGIVVGHDKVVSIADRFEAIKYAITEAAHPGDTVLITGKGHEQSMNIAGVEYNWNDVKAVTEILAGQTKF